MNKLDRLLTHSCVRAIVAPALLMGAYAWAASKYLPLGVTKTFAILVLMPAVGALTLIGILMTLFVRQASGPLVSEDSRLTLHDVALVLLPMGPIAQYLILNREILGASDTLILFIAFLFASILFVTIVPILLRRWCEQGVTTGLSLALLFMLTNMPSLSRTFAWHEQGDARIQFGVLLVSSVICVFLFYKDKKILAFLCIGLFIMSSVQPLMNGIAAPEEQASNPRKIEIYPKPAEHTPDIYLLTYDSYVENETMLQYGIDNSAQEEWLATQGFELYKGTYSVGASSLDSMGRVFGRPDAPRAGTAGQSPLLDQLEQSNYKTHGIFRNGYFFQGVGGHYDHSFPPPSSSPYLLGLAILEGQFRHNADFEMPDEETFILKKRNLLADPGPQPVFLYSHSGPGHSQNSGACRDNETDLFEKRLQQANIEMRSDVKIAIDNQRSAIIIINGDHGPYLTKNCHNLNATEYNTDSVTRLDLQDRYGSFVAIRWPQGKTPASSKHRINLLQDVTPAVLNYLYPTDSFEDYRQYKALVSATPRVANVQVRDGIIQNGTHAGEPLFESQIRSNK